MPTASFFGASVKRVEDPRFLLGKAQYVDEVRIPGTVEVAFVRSPYAHARITSIDVRKALGLPGVVRVFVGADLAGRCSPVRTEVDPSRFPGQFKPADGALIAVDEVRFVGDIVAAVVAVDRYVAEDGAELVDVEYERLPEVSDPEAALEPGSALVHPEWGDNVMARSVVPVGDVDGAFARADVVVSGKFRLNRHCAAPIENRGVIATYDGPRQELTLWSSTQVPHIVRTKVAEAIGHPERLFRVIAPDVGGGFGLKAHVFPEEIVCSFLARELERPVKWMEDRRENLMSSHHSKDIVCSLELALARDGTILGMKGRFVSDIGAYTNSPWTPTIEPIQAALASPGAYKIRAVSLEAIAVATHKQTTGPYRGVGLPAAHYAMEHVLDLAAARLGMDPAEIRLKNILAKDDFPYVSVTGLEYDSATPRETLEIGLEKIGYAAFRKEQAEARSRGRYLGIGICSMMEMTTFGWEFWRRVGIKSHGAAGYDAAHVKVDADGSVTVSVGTLGHGQGHPTVYAQIVADRLGCAVENVTLVQGDTAMTPFGWGTWGSRSAVAGGGAAWTAADKVRDKMLRVAANLLEVSPVDLDVGNGGVSVKGVPQKRLSLRDIARASILEGAIPDSEEPGLDATFRYKAPMPYANATHLAVVEVDPQTGFVKVVRYVVIEDCGRMINPMIVEGQIQGGVAQGIGSALLEHIYYDEEGQLLTGSFMDYLIPTAMDVPTIEIGHLQTPSPLSVGGIKGMGEGGAIAPPAAIANAVSDALSPFGWKTIDRLPITPEVVRRQLSAE